MFVEVSMFRLPNIPTRRIPIVKEPTITEFQFKDVVKGDFVGSGGFGATFIGQYRGKEVALKELNARETEHQKFIKEAKIMSCLNHPNIVEFQGVCYEPFMFMMEYVCFDLSAFGVSRKMNTLDQLIKYCDNFKFETIEHFSVVAALEIVNGIKYLHSKDIAHRDLKPANILISNSDYCRISSKEDKERIFKTKPFTCKLCDFGESRSRLSQTRSILSSRTTHVTRGTLGFMAPELLPGPRCLKSAGTNELKQADIWSLGMTIWCLIHPDLDSPFGIEVCDSSFDCTNPGLSIANKLFSGQRPKTTDLYDNIIVSNWLPLWFVIRGCTMQSTLERYSLDYVSDFLQKKLTLSVKCLAISQSSAQERHDHKIASGLNSCTASTLPLDDGTNCCTFLCLKIGIEIVTLSKVSTNHILSQRIKDLAEDAIDTLPRLVNKYRDHEIYYHPYEALNVLQQITNKYSKFKLQYFLSIDEPTYSDKGMNEIVPFSGILGKV